MNDLLITGKNEWKGKKARVGMYDAEHVALFNSIRDGKPINNGDYMVQSTMVSMMIRMSAYTGKTIYCGGVPMTPEKPSDKVSVDPAFADGTKIGKRYIDAGGAVELLCTKAGQGSLSIDGVPLAAKDAKPLPSSD